MRVLLAIDAEGEVLMKDLVTHVHHNGVHP